jgi:hypothetical protein
MHMLALFTTAQEPLLAHLVGEGAGRLLNLHAFKVLLQHMCSISAEIRVLWVNTNLSMDLQSSHQLSRQAVRSHNRMDEVSHPPLP